MARPKPCAPPVTTAVRPWRSILFMVKPSGRMSEHVATVDDEVDAGGECGLIAGKIDGHIGDFLRGAEPAHLLAGDKFFAAVRTGRRGALEHRGRLHRTRTDAVAADALVDE